MPKISFLILTYNSEKHIKIFLKSFLKQCASSLNNGIYELILLDNASTDETVKIISKYKRKNITIHVSSKNLGYAAGINKAFQFARGEYVCIINPDTEIIKADFDKMQDEFESDSRLGIAGGKMQERQGTTELTAGKFYSPFSLFIFSIGLENAFGFRFAPKVTKEVDFVSGGFIMIRSKLFKELGGFNEKYFMYVEDMELCFRAKKIGFSVKYIPHAVIRHYGQGSSSREFAIVNIYKGILYFYKEHRSISSYFLAKILLKSKALALIIIGIVMGNEDLTKTYLKAIRV